MTVPSPNNENDGVRPSTNSGAMNPPTSSRRRTTSVAPVGCSIPDCDGVADGAAEADAGVPLGPGLVDASGAAHAAAMRTTGAKARVRRRDMALPTQSMQKLFRCVRGKRVVFEIVHPFDSFASKVEHYWTSFVRKSLATLTAFVSCPTGVPGREPFRAPGQLPDRATHARTTPESTRTRAQRQRARRSRQRVPGPYAHVPRLPPGVHLFDRRAVVLRQQGSRQRP